MRAAFDSGVGNLLKHSGRNRIIFLLFLLDRCTGIQRFDNDSLLRFDNDSLLRFFLAGDRDNRRTRRGRYRQRSNRGLLLNILKIDIMHRLLLEEF